MNRYVQYGFPSAPIEPGEQCAVKVEPKNVFRGQKLVMVGYMVEIRGHFKLKYSRLPLLNRENVIAYSNVTRIKAKRRTTVEYRDDIKNSFVRSYLPSSVEYKHVDPLSYIDLLNIFIGNEHQIPASGGGIVAQCFGAEVFGNALPLRTANEGMTVTLSLKNHGDIRVEVMAAILGIERVQEEMTARR